MSTGHRCTWQVMSVSRSDFAVCRFVRRDVESGAVFPDCGRAWSAILHMDSRRSATSPRDAVVAGL